MGLSAVTTNQPTSQLGSPPPSPPQACWKQGRTVVVWSGVCGWLEQQRANAGIPSPSAAQPSQATGSAQWNGLCLWMNALPSPANGNTRTTTSWRRRRTTEDCKWIIRLIRIISGQVALERLNSWPFNNAQQQTNKRIPMTGDMR